ncbi:uncharacterized protein N7483_007187 [Penicillium malachiteum]|uniref:uncharacterized protein n=1 Tax=Penicillium malachiteum TaxID=1324776 RepID=UPI002547BFCA|nr:uncharacterized protein N7483_007187 [Penicillium malachiteum]KAJ5725830.1 hypothetical protein N7483_007187 [Penicillium malachiteum]
MSTITHHEVTYADGIKKIHYLATGPEDGPLIIFVHGWPATAITWKRQLDAFAAVGFRAIAPDMPGYGQSTARRIADDYCQEAIVEGLMALLGDTGRDAAVWVGHDWGSGVVSSVTIQHPEAVKALVNVCVPYNTIELGWDAFLPLVNRDIYPEDKYPYGQWDYQKAYEEDFEKTIEWFDQDVAGLCSLFAQKPGPRPDPKVAAEAMATVRKVGWLGGLAKPPSAAQLGPPILPPEIFDSFSADMQKTGFWTGSAYYLHHKRNAEYNGGRELKFTKPALFVHTKWDVICETKESRLMERMRENCSNLTEVTIDAAHFVMFEKPVELNAALFRFLVDAVPTEWPGYSDSEYAKTK